MVQVKTLYQTEKQAFGYPWLSKKILTHPPKPTEAEPSFNMVSLLPAKLRMLFLTHLWLESFGHKSTPFDRSWIEAYCLTF